MATGILVRIPQVTMELLWRGFLMLHKKPEVYAACGETTCVCVISLSCHCHLCRDLSHNALYGTWPTSLSGNLRSLVYL